jgi:hypothetical protein
MLSRMFQYTKVFSPPYNDERCNKEAAANDTIMAISIKMIGLLLSFSNLFRILL